MFECFLLTMLCPTLRIQKGAKAHVLCPHGAGCWANKHVSWTKMWAKQDANHGKCCQGETHKCSRMWPGIKEDSPEERRLDLPPGRLGNWKEGPCSWSAEIRVVRPGRLLRTYLGALSWYWENQSHWFLRGWSDWNTKFQWLWGTLFFTSYPQNQI